LSIKYIRSSEEIPAGIMRPSTAGVKMPLCQANTIARKWHMAMAVTPEETNCAAALLAFGWGNPGDLNRKEELVNFMVFAGYIKDEERARLSL